MIITATVKIQGEWRTAGDVLANLPDELANELQSRGVAIPLPESEEEAKKKVQEIINKTKDGPKVIADRIPL